MTPTESKQLDKARATQEAVNMWGGFTKNEKTGVRFGMFPADKMTAAQAKLILEGFEDRDMGRLLSVALMECAEKQGGMIA